MAGKETKPKSSELSEQSETSENSVAKERKKFLTPKRLETIVAILLGITTLLSAWAAWIGHLHGGIQSINFTKSNNTAAQSTAEYNLGMQMYLSDYMVWNNAKDYYYELELAKVDGNEKKVELLEEKLEIFNEENASDILVEGIRWMAENDEDDPFKMPGIFEKYFEEAQKTTKQSQELMEEGKHDNAKGDSYMLVTVIYSLTLFLLGIVGTFKNMPNRITLLAIAFMCLVFGFIYMCTIPLPTGIKDMNFFEFNK